MKKIFTVSIGEKGATVMPENNYNHPLTFNFTWPEFHLDKELNEQGKAIANLIKSAPHLLEAALEMVTVSLDGPYAKDARLKLIEAINKANGINTEYPPYSSFPNEHYMIWDNKEKSYVTDHLSNNGLFPSAEGAEDRKQELLDGSHYFQSDYQIHKFKDGKFIESLP